LVIIGAITETPPEAGVVAVVVAGVTGAVVFLEVLQATMKMAADTITVSEIDLDNFILINVL
jgi:hypothetical protein